MPPILMICGRNMHRMRTDEKSIVRNKYFSTLSKGVPQKIDLMFGSAIMGLNSLLICS